MEEAEGKDELAHLREVSASTMVRGMQLGAKARLRVGHTLPRLESGFSIGETCWSSDCIGSRYQPYAVCANES